MAKRPTCAHAAVPADKLGRRIMRKGKAYRCMVKVPEPILPASITHGYGFVWPPPRSHVTAKDCGGCPMRQDPEKEN